MYPQFWKFRFILLIIQRLFFVFITAFRFNKNPYSHYRYKPFKDKLKRLLGIDRLEIIGLYKLPNEFMPLVFSFCGNPLVSIIICVHNNIKYTYNCLKSIQQFTTDIPYEIIVIDDSSIDLTNEVLQSFKNVRVFHNEKNLGFLKSSNFGFSLAKGKYICFLNNDTQVMSGWLEALLNVYDNQKNVGIVGAKLIFPYGLIQEAGGIVNYKGEPGNYGKFEAIDDLKYNYLREADYCSGACMILLKEDFIAVGGFDERYAPAYYEDTDLCFAIRYKLGKRIIYQPLCHVVHYEGVSSGKRAKTNNIKRFQEINAIKFKETWASVFCNFEHSTDANKIANKFTNNQKTILFIEPQLPTYDKDSGSRRLFEIVKIFKELNFRIIFLPDNGIKEEPYYSQMINMGVCVLYKIFKETSFHKVITSFIGEIDIAWICRPEMNEAYGDLIKEHKLFWIYDTVDLHFLRTKRELELVGINQKAIEKEVDIIRKKEITFSKAADLTIAITADEATILKQNGVHNVEVIPNIHTSNNKNRLPFSEREDMCFIGGYRHKPNVDAVVWLAKEIMPLIWEIIPDIKLTLLGSSPPDEVLALQSKNIVVTGYLADVSDYFEKSRVFVAPLRFGAGMKGKIGQSLEFNLPIVTTDIGAEGMGLVDGRDVLIANDAETFAKKVLNLYTNEVLWNEISLNSHKALTAYSPENVKKRISKLIDIN